MEKKEPIYFFRLVLTNLISELHKHGIYLDHEDESDNETTSSLDEGIDEHSLSALDLSSKLSSHNNSENNEEEEFVWLIFNTYIEKKCL